MRALSELEGLLPHVQAAGDDDGFKGLTGADGLELFKDLESKFPKRELGPEMPKKKDRKAIYRALWIVQKPVPGWGQDKSKDGAWVMSQFLQYWHRKGDRLSRAGPAASYAVPSLKYLRNATPLDVCGHLDCHVVEGTDEGWANTEQFEGRELLSLGLGLGVFFIVFIFFADGAWC